MPSTPTFTFTTSSLPEPVRPVRRWGIVVIVTIVVVNGLLGVLQALGASGGEAAASWWALVDVDAEANVPTWISTLLLAASAAASALVARRHRLRGRADHRWWFAVSAAFAVASLDEAVSLHERLIEPLRSALDLSGIFYWAWVVPGLVAVVALAITFRGFVGRLAPAVRWRFLAGAGLFFGGALGLEMVGGALFTSMGAGIATGLVALLEETLELLGALVWLEGTLLALVRDAGAGDPTTAAAAVSAGAGVTQFDHARRG